MANSLWLEILLLRHVVHKCNAACAASRTACATAHSSGGQPLSICRLTARSIPEPHPGCPARGESSRASSTETIASLIGTLSVDTRLSGPSLRSFNSFTPMDSSTYPPGEQTALKDTLPRSQTDETSRGSMLPRSPGSLWHTHRLAAGNVSRPPPVAALRVSSPDFRLERQSRTTQPHRTRPGR